MGTLVERSTRFLLLLHLPKDHGAVSVEEAMRKAITTLPAELTRSITWDQGSEMARHRDFTIATGIPIYFCDPHSPCNEARTRTPTACYANIYPKAPTYRRTPPTTWPPSNAASTDDHEKPSAIECRKRN